MRATATALLIAAALPGRAAGACATSVDPGRATSTTRCDDGRTCASRWATPARVETSCSDGSTSVVVYDPVRRAWDVVVRDRRGAVVERCTLGRDCS